MHFSVPSRQNHLQNTVSLAVFMLIICYYAFNGTPSDTFEEREVLISSEQSNQVYFEQSISRLRAAILMDADEVEIKGLMYAVENSLGKIVGAKKAKKAVEQIQAKWQVADRKTTVFLINALPTLLTSQ